MCFSDKELLDMEVKIARATEGPYRVMPWPSESEMLVVESDTCGPVCVVDPTRDFDADNIVQALTNMPKLIAEVKRLRLQNQALSGERNHLKERLDRAMWPGVMA